MSKKSSPQSSTVLLVGKKPTMNYVLYIVNKAPETEQIVLKARGRTIPKAVDIAEILRRRFMKNLKVKNIELGTEEIEDKNKEVKRRISTIEISLEK